MTDMRVKLLLDFVKRGRAGKEARDELKGIKTEADRLKSTGGPDRLNRSLGETSSKARKLAGDLSKAKAEAKALAATDARPRVSAYNGLKDMARPKDRAKDLLRNSAAGAAGAAMGGLGLAGVAGAGGAAALGAKGLGESLALERAMYDVSRATDASAEGLAGYRKEITQLSVATGQAAPELAGMLAQAGFAGRPKEELLAFMKYSAAAMTAWGTNAEQTGQSLAEIGNIYGANQKRIEEIGDAVNTVADASAAKETDLLNVLNRAGAAGRMIKVSAEQTLAMAGALKEVGQAPEVIGTSLNALFQNLSLGDEATKEFSDGLKAIGTNSKKLQAAVRKDAMGAIVDLLEKIKAVPDDLKRMQVLKQLFGREYADNIGALLNNLEGLKRLLGLMGDKKNYAGSVQRDVEKKLQQDFNRLERANQAISELARRLGDPLKIAAGSVAEGIVKMLEAYDQAKEARNKMDDAAKRVVEGKASQADVDTLAASDEGKAAIAGAGTAKAKADMRSDAAQTGDRIKHLPPEQQLAEQGSLLRRNLQRRIDALEKEIALTDPKGEKQGRASLLKRLKAERDALPDDTLQRQRVSPNVHPDHDGRIIDAAAEAKARAEREQDGARRELINTLYPVRRTGLSAPPSPEEQGPMAPSTVPVPPRRPADLRAAMHVDLQPAGALMSEQIAEGIKSRQSATDGAAQQIGEGVKGRLSAVDAAAAGQQAMASFAQGLEAGGAQAVAAAQRVAAQVQSALKVNVAGLGGGGVRARTGGALHDGVG